MSLEWMNLQDIVSLDTQKGLISFRGNRLLLFHADALSQLKDELIKTLGMDLARGVLVRFGYRCGYSDSQSVKNYFNPETDAEWMLAGPTIHTLEGLVQVTNEVLDYDRSTGHFYMRGIWRNSYEAEEYLKSYGSSLEPVCWTLVGYASGYSSGFMGRDAVCVETKCIAKGDPYCQYEIRTKEEWTSEADRYWQDLQPNAVVKSLQHMLREERDRVNQWKVLNETVMNLSEGLDFNESDIDLYRQVCQMVLAEKIYLVVNKVESKGYDVFRYKLGSSEVVHKTFGQVKGVLANLLANGAPLRLHGDDLPDNFPFITPAKDFLGVPLVSNGRQIGSLIAANKLTGHGFNEDDQNLLVLLGTQVAMVIENTRLYRLTDRKLQEKNLELNRVNEYLLRQHAAMQKSIDLHDQLTGLVLGDAGLQQITQAISQSLGLPVWIEDKEFMILAESRGGEGRAVSSREMVQDLPAEPEGFYTRRETAVIQAVDKAGNATRRCLTPVVAGGEILGFLTVDLLDQYLAEDKKLILRDASVLIALEILKQKVLIENRRRLVENLLREWLFAENFTEEQVMAWCLRSGLTLEYPISLMVMEFEGSGLGQVSKFVSDITDGMPANGLLGFQENRIVVLYCRDEDNCLVKNLAQKLVEGLKDFPAMKWWITIGAKSGSIAETRQNYTNACTANQIMRQLNKSNICFGYEQLGVYGMLGIHPERFVWFTRNLLGEVMDYDKKHNTELISTLKLYFQNNQNIQAAARRGYLNDGTLKYRLKRIQEIARLDLADAEVNLQVQLALKFL